LSLGIGVASLVFSWVPLLGLLVGLVAIVLSAVALAKVVSKTKPAIGIGLGIVALAINVIVIAALGSAVPSHVNAAATVPSIATPAADPTVEATKALSVKVELDTPWCVRSESTAGRDRMIQSRDLDDC
jgi:hypothetical protein